MSKTNQTSPLPRCPSLITKNYKPSLPLRQAASGSKIADSSSQSGFTLVELLMAMTLFSFMLILITSGFITVAKIYQSTLAARKTQSSARLAIEEVARQARNANTAQLAGGNTLCLYGTSNVRFRLIDNGTTSSLVREVFTNCADLAVYSDRQTLTPPDLRVPLSNGFVASILDSTSPTPSVEFTLKVTTNTPDLINGLNNCSQGVPGTQFCSTTLLTTSVALRGE